MRYLAPVLMSLIAVSSAIAQSPDGATVMSASCTGCHNLRIIANAGRSRASWAATVGDMVQRGAPVFPEEMKILIDYLAETVGPKKAAPVEQQKKTDVP